MSSPPYCTELSVTCPSGLFCNQPRNFAKIPVTCPSSPLYNQPRYCVYLTYKLPYWPALHSLRKLRISAGHLHFCLALQSTQKLCSYVWAQTVSQDYTILISNSCSLILFSSIKLSICFCQWILLLALSSLEKLCISQVDDLYSLWKLHRLAE